MTSYACCNFLLYTAIKCITSLSLYILSTFKYTWFHIVSDFIKQKYWIVLQLVHNFQIISKYDFSLFPIASTGGGKENTSVIIILWLIFNTMFLFYKKGKTLWNFHLLRPSKQDIQSSHQQYGRYLLTPHARKEGHCWLAGWFKASSCWLPLKL